MAQPSFDAEFLSVAEVAALVRLSPKTVIREIGRGNLRAIKVVTQWRIPVAAYRAWIKANPTED